MIKYFAQLDTGSIVYIGAFANYSDAFDAEPANAHWVHTEDGLRAMLGSASRALRTADEEL